jgi:Leucine-rich repeat (LRR) protein
MKIKELETKNNWHIIDFSHNSIESADFPDLLRKQIDLETLSLNFNFNFSGRGNQQIFTQKTMKNFECVMCGFTEVQSQHFAGLVSLEQLALNENRINRIDKDAFKSNANLKLLDLSGNQLKTVMHSLFVGLEKLEALYLTMNPIEMPKNKPFLKSNSLKHLKMECCNMTSIYLETFTEVRNLETLDLNRNLIPSLPVNSFKFNVKLKSLFVESNRLRFFSTATMDMLPLLTELCIDNNSFTNSSELVKFVKKYDEKKMRTDNCNDNTEYFIENFLR